MVLGLQVGIKGKEVAMVIHSAASGDGMGWDSSEVVPAK
jgi:hypothetical protein